MNSCLIHVVFHEVFSVIWSALAPPVPLPSPGAKVAPSRSRESIDRRGSEAWALWRVPRGCCTRCWRRGWAGLPRPQASRQMARWRALVDAGAAAAAAAAGAMGGGGERFLYFAYGSNLLAERLRINNPSAERVAAARLDGFRLDFGYMSPRWGGHAATIVPQPGRLVWGAVWSVGQEHLDDLDRQEGVQSGVYVPIQVDVHSNDGRKLHCRSYHLREQPPSPLPEGLLITEGRLPSKIYWQVIVQGAHETGLPSDYIDFLEKIPHNDYMGNFSIGQLASNLQEINTPLDNK